MIALLVSLKSEIFCSLEKHALAWTVTLSPAFNSGSIDKNIYTSAKGAKTNVSKLFRQIFYGEKKNTDCCKLSPEMYYLTITFLS